MNFLVIFMLLLPATVSSDDMRKKVDHCKDWSRKIVRCRRHILVKGYGGPRKFVRIMVRISWRSFLRRYRFNPKFPDLHDMFYKVDQRICPPDIFAYTCSLNIATCTHTFHIGMPLRPCRETCMNFATACKDKYVSPSLHMTVGFLRHNCRYLPFYDDKLCMQPDMRTGWTYDQSWDWYIIRNFTKDFYEAFFRSQYTFAFTGKVISINETGRPDNPYVTARVQVTRLIKEDESRSLSLKVMQFYGGNRRCPTRGTYACYREGGEFGFFGHDNMVQGLTISFSLTLPDEQFLLDIVETLWRTKYKAELTEILKQRRIEEEIKRKKEQKKLEQRRKNQRKKPKKTKEQRKLEMIILTASGRQQHQDGG
ncbi:uncharacterized protein [Pocillopora verrucosa]|uniref:uncharacterized protein n=1 Tax=Pocillopora verrucosa TaxID=203993 RepID=UPI00279725FD|nr:uncharacterized protein LOC131791322 [Pocillopora verrucosa]